MKAKEKKPLTDNQKIEYTIGVLTGKHDLNYNLKSAKKLAREIVKELESFNLT